MSIELMAKAWRLPIPATEKMVLLCLCDYANGQGTCWPGAESMADRCSLTERTIRKALKWLEAGQWIASEPRPGRTAIYHIDPGSKFTPEANSPRNLTRQPRKEIPDTPEAGSDEPSITIKEPPIREPNGSCQLAADQPEKLSFGLIVKQWNILAEAKGLPRVEKQTDQRKRAFRVRAREYPDLDDWKRAILNIRDNEWLCGDNDRGWRADFDFLLQAKSFPRLVEGTYGKR